MRFGLEDVADLAFQNWRPRGTAGPDAALGAIGRRGGKGDPEILNLIRASTGTGQHPGEPMNRMFGTPTGRRAAQAVGNETRTLAVLQRLSVEATAQALTDTGFARPSDRLVFMPAQRGRPPILLLMSPDVQDVANSRIISDEVDLPFPIMDKATQKLDPDDRTPEATAFHEVRRAGHAGVAELFLIAQPEVVLTRRPRMVPLCAPSPHMRVDAGGQTSTAGVFCRDETGVLGVTACYHGTGDVGTQVSVGPHAGQVKYASEVQDLVFIPLGDAFTLPSLVGRGGVRDGSEPGRSDRVKFEGAVNQRTTRIFSTDTGLLRVRPSVQLKLQTNPDTDEGDSGSALIDDQDRILGFAFERTAYDDHPQFTDWIWAANALRALKLTPI